ncbi:MULTISPECIES: NADH-quinone oxidoreductase subunit L [unclassified Streptomyces]|uniref:NADH-quinone oxidoreductase subunit 5 family protein n=1 Tax=unclassified Streptomyces TaxID=2593676 RepID=UPI002E0FE2A3|nr:NADH-quinone oxidoreductase subunit L [Streptomyces sp. NBC_01186]WSS43156.1 NADH-quinone oxidoreductase subunit L [Streptomyces sp. NBC_01187]
MSTTTLAALVPVLPFLGAVAGLLLGRRAPGFVRPLAVLPTVVAAGLAVVVAVRQGGGAPLRAATELTPTGNDALPVQLALQLDGFAVLVAVLVGVVASCVQLYSTGYLREDPRYPSYAALVSLFTAAMFLVVYSDDLIVLLVGWEIMGICSYFLVGHYWETTAARSASLKAFLVTKLGDVPFLIGILALASETGSFRISTVVTRVTSSLSGFELSHPTVIALLLLAGVAGKSAQFPLHSWLPDAMAGPTPVSALIHAATMVAAGIYFVARLLPVFAASSAALVVLALMAALTMTGAALAALAQDDIKRVLAFSTISQLAYMAGALAVADRGAAVFHLLTHGAFKALLFLAAGVVIHAAGTNSLTVMARTGGIAKRAPDAFWTMTIALLALAAIPPFSGFFSKEAVLAAAEHAAFGDAHAAFEGAPGVPVSAGWIVLAAGLLTALLTAAYAARLWLLAGAPERLRETHGAPLRETHGAPAGAPATGASATEASASAPGPAGNGAVSGAAADSGPVPLAVGAEKAAEHVPEAVPQQAPETELAMPAPGRADDGQRREPVVMTAVLWALALPSLAAGLGFLVLPDWFDGRSLAPTLTTSVLSTGVALVGGIVTYATWRHTTAHAALHPEYDVDPGLLLLGPLHRHAAAGFHLDAVYAALVVRPLQGAARLVRFVDREVVDTYVNGAGRGSRLLGAAVRRAQTGNVQTYLGALLTGSLVLAIAAVLAATGNGGA